MPVVQGDEKLENAYTQGFFAGDGWETSKVSAILLYGKEKQQLQQRMTGVKATGTVLKGNRVFVNLVGEFKSKNFVPAGTVKIEDRLDWFAGLLDSDGTICRNPNSTSLQVGGVDFDFLIRTQSMLTTLGVQAKVTEAHAAGPRQMPDGKGSKAIYQCQTGYRLLVNAADTAHLAGLGLRCSRLDLTVLQPQRDARRFTTVISVEPDGCESVVYCFTEPKNHTGTFNGIVTGQCGEQTLEPYELCCLCETFPSRHATLTEYQETLKFAYLYAKTVTLIPTHIPETNVVMMRNRRIGTSQSGITASFQRHGRAQHFHWSDEGYKSLKKLDRKYSEWLAVPMSVKITSIKPSGTVSLLPGVPPGIHYPISEYYIRRIRIAMTSPLLNALLDAGYYVEPSVTDPSTAVAEFPVRESFFSRGESDVSMWEQLENAAQMQHYWADNQVSVTVKFNPATEGKDIEYALDLYQGRLKSVSFLPNEGANYAQMPYEPISKEVYEERIKNLKPVDFSNAVNEQQERFCDGGTCTIG